jgi:nicotinate-nucleotide adenylyltransferase
MVKSGRADPIGLWGDGRRCRIGLLGGSFNPAHDGHLHVAQAALTHLGLDQVWFLVSPQNPLKSRADMAPLAQRLGRAQFVWLMGADNFLQVCQWDRWTRLFALLPVAIIDRPPYSKAAMTAKAARRFFRFRSPARALMSRALRAGDLPAWSFLHLRRHPASATQLRVKHEQQESSIEHQTSSNPTQVELITASLTEDKGEDILVIDLRGRTSIADYMIISTGKSARQVGAMAHHVVERLKQVGIRSTLEGLGASDWVLIDSGDVIVHLFRPEVRSFYNLEKMWLPEDLEREFRAAGRSSLGSTEGV